MRSVLRSPFPGERPRRRDAHLDSLMASDGPSSTVAPFLRALAADPRPHELGGFEEPLASYRAAFRRSRPPAPKMWRPSMLSSLLGAKLGATIAGLAVGLGGTAVVAYSGALPNGAQNIAHTTIGAPAAPAATSHPNATGKPTTGKPVGPDAKGPAAYGLCNAWSHHQTNGASTHGKANRSVAFKNLATAAGGENKIAAYCAKIPHPGKTSHPTRKPTGKPTKHPTGKPTKQATGKPTKHPTGEPTTLPTPTSTTQQ